MPNTPADPTLHSEPVGFGPRLIQGLTDAQEGNFTRVTIDGQAWVPETPLHRAAHDLLEALEEAREFIDGQIDVVDGSYGIPEPNRAMSLARVIDEALKKATGA